MFGAEASGDFTGGYSEFYDERGGMGGLGDVDIGMGSLLYTPSTASVGSGSTYWPGDVSSDAEALNYIGYTTGPVKPSTGSQQGDMAAQSGAWDGNFKEAVKTFQIDHLLTPDGWIGPKTRAAIGLAVAAKNASESPIQPPIPPSPAPPFPGLPIPPPAVIPGLSPPMIPQPGGGGGPAPSHASPEPNYLLYGGVAVGALALVAGAYYLLK